MNLWDEVLARIETKINRHSFYTWFKPTSYIKADAAVVTVRGEWVRPQSLSSTALAAILLSGAATGLSWLCYYRALQLAPASRVAPVDKLSVVLVVVFGALFLHEELTWQVGVGAAFVSLGAAIMVM